MRRAGTWFTALVLTFAGSVAAQAPDRSAAIAALEQQLAAQPDDPLVAFMLASYHAQGGDKARAVALLDGISGNGIGIFPPPDRFKAIAAMPEYRRVLRKFEKSQPAVLRGKVARDAGKFRLATEGIAFDPADGAIYLSGGDRNIVSVDKDGRQRELVRSGQDGLAATLGMKLEPARDLIWVASYRDAEIGGDGTPGVYAFDLATGKTVAKHVPEGADGASTFNDLVVARDGTVYVTDTASGALYRIKRGGKLEPFVPPGTFRFPNGIALSDDEKYAFVAQWRMPVRVELATGRTTPLAVPAGVVTAGIDGLYWHRGSLIAVQNVAHPGRVVRLRLNAALDAVTGLEVLESRNPHFAPPTTAAIDGDTAYVLANSYIGSFGKDGKPLPDAIIKPTVILAVPL